MLGDGSMIGPTALTASQRALQHSPAICSSGSSRGCSVLPEGAQMMKLGPNWSVAINVLA